MAHPAVAAGAVVALALVNPSLPNTVRIASYEVPVAMLVVGLLWAIQRDLDEPGPRWLLAVSAIAALGVLTRSASMTAAVRLAPVSAANCRARRSGLVALDAQRHGTNLPAKAERRNH